MIVEPIEPIEIFICYAREDEEHRLSLEKQLRILKRQGLITIWHDREIVPGTDWQSEIDKHLKSAQIILLLVSPDFMDSDYCYSIEMQNAMERHQRGEAYVIPIIIHHVYWQEAPFGKLQVLPSDARPITDHSWHNLNEAFFNVAVGIREVIKKIREEQQRQEEEERQRKLREEQLRLAEEEQQRKLREEEQLRQQEEEERQRKLREEQQRQAAKEWQRQLAENIHLSSLQYTVEEEPKSPTLNYYPNQTIKDNNRILKHDVSREIMLIEKKKNRANDIAGVGCIGSIIAIIFLVFSLVKGFGWVYLLIGFVLFIITFVWFIYFVNIWSNLRHQLEEISSKPKSL